LLYSPVIAFDDEDRRDHLRYNVSRYLGQVVRLAPAAAARALRGPRLLRLDDATFTAILTRTSLGQFVSLEIEARDREAFAADLGGDPGRRFAKVDFSFAPADLALAGVHVAPTVVLLHRGEGDAYRAAAIRVGDGVVRPGDGAAWELARYFALQGANVRLVLAEHPRLHFPNDVVNAITRSALPEGHVVHRLLRPHTRFTLGLDAAVIHHRRSVLHNSQRELYSPFPYTTEGTHAQVAVSRGGLPGVRAYRAYRFGDSLMGDHVPYGRFRRDWFELYVELTTRIAALVPRDDPYVRAWADHLHEWLPGFPAGDVIQREGTLARALASFICDVSVFHSADHHSYAAIPPAQIPLRLRAPPPDRRAPGALDPGALVWPEDHFRHLLCHAMFFAPVVIRSLRQVRYEIAGAREALSSLRSGMDALDAKWAGSGFPASGQIACSIQY
jgi:hypothetical protein